MKPESSSKRHHGSNYCWREETRYSRSTDREPYPRPDRIAISIRGLRLIYGLTRNCLLLVNVPPGVVTVTTPVVAS